MTVINKLATRIRFDTTIAIVLTSNTQPNTINVNETLHRSFVMTMRRIYGTTNREHEKSKFLWATCVVLISGLIFVFVFQIHCKCSPRSRFYQIDKLCKFTAIMSDLQIMLFHNCFGYLDGSLFAVSPSPKLALRWMALRHIIIGVDTKRSPS